jgi:hypothetical protein
MLLFAVILFGFRTRAEHPGVGIRLAALAAFSAAFVSMIFEIVPVGEVASPVSFGIKVTVSIVATNALGAYLYWRGSRRLRSIAAIS